MIKEAFNERIQDIPVVDVGQLKLSQLRMEKSPPVSLQ
jgi:hypothetical protein